MRPVKVGCEGAEAPARRWGWSVGRRGEGEERAVRTLTSAFPLGIEQCRAGTGLVDYRTYLSELDRLPPDTPLLTEPLPGMEEYEYDLTSRSKTQLGSGI